MKTILKALLVILLAITPAVAIDFDSNPPGIYLTANGKTPLSTVRIPYPNYANIGAVMASPPTVTSNTSAATLARMWAGCGDYPVCSVTSEFFTHNKNGTITTGYPTLSYGQDSVGVSFNHYGVAFELQMAQTSTNFLIKINDQYVSLTPTSTGTTNGGTTFFKYTFGSAAWRRVDVIGFNIALSNVWAGATDTITPAPNRGPVGVIIGDSFSQGGSYLPQQALADAFGWDNIASSGVSSTGYLANAGGISPTFRQRIVHDVIAQNPEFVGIYGGVNDAGTSPSLVGAEALLLYQQLRSALPNAVIWATMNGGWGVGGMSANYLAVKAALKSAASTAGVLWIDIDEYPIPTNSVTIQVVGGCCSASAGSTYFNTTELNGGPDTPPSGSTWQMGSGSTLERFQVKSVTPQAPNNVLIYPVSPLQYNHSAGDTITLVGGALYSGTGNSGSPSGFGNADVITSPDGLHPNDSPAGTGQIGAAIAQLLLQATAPN